MQKLLFIMQKIAQQAEAPKYFQIWYNRNKIIILEYSVQRFLCNSSKNGL